MSILRLLAIPAAQLPLLGLLLMAVGAAFPTDSQVGLVLVIVGANVTFYTLRSFGEALDWQAAPRPLLAFSGGLCVLASLLLAAASQIETLHRCLALLAAGVYLGLFAVSLWHPAVSPAWRVASYCGLLCLTFGGMAAVWTWPEWRIYAESREAPQEITLAQLLAQGCGANRHVKVTGFQFCDAGAIEKHGDSRVFEVWTPLVVANAADVPDAPAPAVPPRIAAVSIAASFGDPAARKRPGAPAMLDVLRRKWQREGYDALDVTGIRRISPQVREQLTAWGPQTDFDHLLQLSSRDRGSPVVVYGGLYGGLAVALAGLGLLTSVYLRAWQVDKNGLPMPPPLDETGTDPKLSA